MRILALMLTACTPNPGDSAASDPTVPLPSDTGTSSTTGATIQPGTCEATTYSGVVQAELYVRDRVIYDDQGRELRKRYYWEGELVAETRWTWDAPGHRIRRTDDEDLDGEADWETVWTWSGDQLVHERFEELATGQSCEIVYEHDDADEHPERELDGCTDYSHVTTYDLSKPSLVASVFSDRAMDGTIDGEMHCTWDAAQQLDTCSVTSELVDWITDETYDGELLVRHDRDEDLDGLWDYRVDYTYDDQDRLIETESTAVGQAPHTTTIAWECF